MTAMEEPAQADEPNPAAATRMAVIAGMSHNTIVGTIFGTAGVLLQPIQHRLHLSPEVSTVGVPLVIVGSAIVSSVAGVLAARYSLRVLFMVSAAMATGAWLLLASTASFTVYVICYGLLLGPAMAMAGSVLPPTLVTRWFNRNRGLALGLVHLPIVVAIMPVPMNWIIEHYGVEAVFLCLAALCGLVLLPATMLVVNRPPGQAAELRADNRQAIATGSSLTLWQIMRIPRFWALAAAVAAINGSSVILNVHLVGMAVSWGIPRSGGAALLSIMAVVSLVGSALFGWITDRIGGCRALALISLDAGILWLLLLLKLPFAGLAVVFGLIGIHGAGAIPSLSRGLAEIFGREGFSRAFGLAATVTLPLPLIGVFGTGAVYRIFGNYVVTIVTMVAYFALAIPLALYAARPRRRTAGTTA